LAESVEARPETDTPVSVRETADGALFIETGGNQWAVEQSGTMPFSRAYLGEREVLPNDGVQSSVRFDGENFELRIGTRPVVEEAGPLRVVVRADGIALGADGSPGFDVTARIYAHAGCSWLRVYLTLTNRIRQKLVHLEEFKVSLAPTLDDMEFPPWDDDGETAEQPRRADPQYEILPGASGDGADRRTGANGCNLMPAAAVLGDEQTTVSLQCRRFCHQAPKEMAMTPMRAELSLYANWAEPLEFHRGVAKTHELIIDVTAKRPRRQARTAFAAGFEKQPSFQVVTRNWMVDSGVFGPIFRYQPEKYRWCEYILRQVSQTHTFNIEADSSKGFHFLNYGDFWTPGRGANGRTMRWTRDLASSCK
jgi:hypothetical protein